MAAGIPRQRIFIMPMSGAESDSSFVTADDLEAEGRLLPHTSPSTWTKGQGARQTAYLGYSSGTSGLPVSNPTFHHSIASPFGGRRSCQGSEGCHVVSPQRHRQHPPDVHRRGSVSP